MKSWAKAETTTLHPARNDRWEDSPSSFAHSVPPSFSLIYINNWGLSRKDTWCGSDGGAQKESVSLWLAKRKDVFFFSSLYDMSNNGPACVAACLFIFQLFSATSLDAKILTLCPGSRWVLPGWPTTKWTSAISSLLNITEFLQRERKKRREREEGTNRKLGDFKAH